MELSALYDIMKRLRDPENGCPWDIAQDFATIAPYTIEEAYEVADAIERADMDELRDELGDLLLQVLFHSVMAEQQDHFTLSDVVESICTKMVRRHPHVFAGEGPSGHSEGRWEEAKAAERADKKGQEGALDGVALALPALLRAQKLQKRAARVGFDWPDIAGVRAKIDEELGEVDEANSADEIAEEIGDLLFSAVNLARHHGVDAEQALRSANGKFERRFRIVEQMADGDPAGHSLEELERFWQAAKDMPD